MGPILAVFANTRHALRPWGQEEGEGRPSEAAAAELLSICSATAALALLASALTLERLQGAEALGGGAMRRRGPRWGGLGGERPWVGAPQWGKALDGGKGAGTRRRSGCWFLSHVQLRLEKGESVPCREGLWTEPGDT